MFTRSVAAQPLESLEPRTLMAAPTAVVEWATVRPTDWLVVVRYADSDGDLQAASIGDGDIAVTGAGYAAPGRLFQPVIPQSDGSVRAVYRLPAAGGAWDWSDNGVYQLTVTAGAVTDAASNDASGGRDFNLWFDAPRVRVISSQITDFNRKWTVTLEASDTGGMAAIASGAEIIRVRGPGGYVTTARTTASVAAGAVQRMTFDIDAPGGGFDYSDTGTYRIETVSGALVDAGGASAPVFQVYSAYLWFTNPKIELVSASLTEDRFNATLRVSDNDGINPSTFSNPAGVGIFETQSSVAYSKISRQIGEPRLQSDGSYLVDVYFPSKYVYWSWQESQRYQLVASPGISDINGVRATSSRLAFYWLWWDRPTVIFDSGSSGIRPDGSIEVNLRIKARNGLAAGTISADDVTMRGPSDSLYSASLISTSVMSDGYTRARFRFTPPTGGFAGGSYTISTVRGGIMDLEGFMSGEGRVTSYTVTGP